MWATRPRVLALSQGPAQDAGEAEDARTEQHDAAWLRGRSKRVDGTGPKVETILIGALKGDSDLSGGYEYDIEHGNKVGCAPVGPHASPQRTTVCVESFLQNGIHGIRDNP